MKEKHTLVLIYNSFKDPLFQNLMLKYILKLSENPHLKFHLITFEQSQYGMAPNEMAKEIDTLADKNIYWTPLQFHTGRFILLKKAWDLLQLLRVTIQLRKKYQLRYIMAFANISAALSGVITKFFKLKLIIYSYEPHAKFMVDMGHWSSSSLKFKILNHLELLAAKQAHHIMTGTHAMKEVLLEYNSENKISVAPTAVDPSNYQFSLDSRNCIRCELNAVEKKILLYIGKLGGLYYEKETIAMMCQITKWNEQIISIIITEYNHNQIRKWIEDLNGESNRFIIKNPIDKNKVANYLSAADIGIIGIPPLPHQKFRSPTKTAEFLLCGLPTLICDDISEDSQYIEKNDLGCVVRSFKPEDINSKKEEILSLFDLHRVEFSTKSRAKAISYRSIEKVHDILNKIYQEE